MSQSLDHVAETAEAARLAHAAYVEAVAERNAAIADALRAGEQQIPIAAAGKVSQATVSRVERALKGGGDE